MKLPEYALSVRQPWTWAIADGGKRLENRGHVAMRHLTRRGLVCLHASGGMTQREYYWARDFMRQIGVDCPPPHELLRGGIVAIMNVTGAVKASHDPWFMGPRALVLEDVTPIDFIPCAGALGFFRWQASEDGAAIAPAKWMLPKDAVAGQEGML